MEDKEKRLQDDLARLGIDAAFETRQNEFKKVHNELKQFLARARGEKNSQDGSDYGTERDASYLTQSDAFTKETVLVDANRDQKMDRSREQRKSKPATARQGGYFDGIERHSNRSESSYY